MIFPFWYCQRGNLENEINFTKSQILVKALICIPNNPNKYDAKIFSRAI